MRSKDNKISKLMQITKAPIRILSKARDSYVKGMFDFAGSVKVGCGCIGGGAGLLTKSYSVNTTRQVDEEEFRQLLRVLSEKENEVGSSVQYCKQGDEKACNMDNDGMKRSYSVGLGKIGKIDEDRPCSFREDINANLYSKSGNDVAGKKVIVYH